MARNRTVQELVDEIQVLVEDSAHALASEAEYIRRVSRAHARLYAMYVAAEPDRYRTEATIVAGTGGTSSYDLPADWLSTIGVDYASGNERTALKRLSEEERNDYTGQSGTSEAFRLLGAKVHLYPTPITGQTYTHIYLPTAPDLTAVGTQVDLRLGHEVYIEYAVARDLLKKEESYDGRWDDTIAQIESDLKTEANWRYFTDVVTMAQARQRRAWPYGPDGPGLSWPWPVPR